MSGYTFDNVARIGNDACSQDIRTLQNTQYSNYMLQNFMLTDCTMKHAIQFATSQSGINFSGTNTTDICGSNVDDNSMLLFGEVQSNPRCRIDLVHRPFATVPFLGRGSGDPVLESQMQQGELVSSRKSSTKLPENLQYTYEFTPLIPEMAHQINGGTQSMQVSQWAGLPTRSMAKDCSRQKQR